MTRLPLALGLAVLLAGCGKDAATPTSATAPDGLVDGTSRLFTGTLPPGDTQFYSFSIAQDSGVFVTLASVTGVDTRDASDTPLLLGLGVPRGTGCATTARPMFAAALTPQIREFTTQGVHCVSVSDPGTLKSPVRFAVRIGYYQ